jgi:uncharacterized protein (TIGR02594 family)
MLTRRQSIIGGSLLLTSGGRVAAQGFTDSPLPPLPVDLRSSREPDASGVVVEYTGFGTAEPTQPEKEKAKLVLAKAQKIASPVDVARYFLDVAGGKYGEDWRPYTVAWPVRWNPVIVEFFQSIHSSSAGDTTAWCSAFVNYCLINAAKSSPPAAGASKPTLSAASRSFRTWGQEVGGSTKVPPRPGDIAVFVNVNDNAHGHVGFFVAEDADRVFVLGGNQFEGAPVRHAISQKWLAKREGVLRLHSYRTDASLHP